MTTRVDPGCGYGNTFEHVSSQITAAHGSIADVKKKAFRMDVVNVMTTRADGDLTASSRRRREVTT